MGLTEEQDLVFQMNNMVGREVEFCQNLVNCIAYFPLASDKGRENTRTNNNSLLWKEKLRQRVVKCDIHYFGGVEEKNGL